MTPEDRLDAIARAARHAETDENLGDWTESRETILWFATDGNEGVDWGSAYDDSEEEPW